MEPKWKVGHGASGGRADIMIKDNSGKSLLILECKTEGKELASALDAWSVNTRDRYTPIHRKNPLARGDE